MLGRLWRLDGDDNSRVKSADARADAASRMPINASDDARVSYARDDVVLVRDADVAVPRRRARGDARRRTSRVLRPGGQLWVTEMDFETEGFRKLRASPAFVFIRSRSVPRTIDADFGAAGVAEAGTDAGFGRVEAVRDGAPLARAV